MVPACVTSSLQRLRKVGNFFDEIQKNLHFVMGFKSNLINLLAPGRWEPSSERISCEDETNCLVQRPMHDISRDRVDHRPPRFLSSLLSTASSLPAI